MYVKEGWKDADSGRIGDPRIQFMNFQQLQDSLSNSVKRLSVKLEIELIEDEHIKFFKDLIKNNKGNQDIVFNVFGNGDGLKVNLSSTKYKVKINEQLLKSLKEKKLDFRLN
jgi:DNA polymerase-3 subunit alpha